MTKQRDTKWYPGTIWALDCPRCGARRDTPCFKEGSKRTQRTRMHRERARTMEQIWQGYTDAMVKAADTLVAFANLLKNPPKKRLTKDGKPWLK